MREATHSPHEQPPHSYQYNRLPEHEQQQHGVGGGGTTNSSSTPTKAEYFIAQLNVTNAKKVAALMVLGFICYHGLIHLHYGEKCILRAYMLWFSQSVQILGTDSCKWLLSDGRFKGDREWQPYGCMMHKYTQA